MNYFKSTSNQDLDPYFIDYLSRLQSFISEKMSIQADGILEMVSVSKIDHNEMSLFLDYNDSNLNRALLYMLLREDSLGVSNKYPDQFSNFMYEGEWIKELFNESGQVYFDIDETETFLSENGIAAIVHCFPVNNQKIRIELTRMMYEDVADCEIEISSSFSFAEDMTPFLGASVRSLSIMGGKVFAGRCYADADIPREVFEMASPDFFFLDKPAQAEIIRAALLTMSEFERSYFKSSRTGVIESLATYWPVEFIRSRVVAGDFKVSDIESARGVIEILLSNIMSDRSEMEIVCENIVKLALIPFKDQFNLIYGDEIPNIGKIISHEENLFDTGGGDSARYWSGFDFSHWATSLGLAQGIFRMLSQYDGYTDSIAKYCGNSKFMTVAGIQSLARSSVFSENELEKDAIKNWLSSQQNHREAHYNSLKNVSESIGIAGDQDIINSYNLSLLSCFRIEIDGQSQATSLLPARFIFSGVEDRRKFIADNNIYKDSATVVMVDAGGFTQADFMPYWKITSREIKRALIQNDLCP